ncbi:uncharacterized protein PITG_12723 [Phytophthora infestans T30-4]|uniref:Uncharacterized protein n=1 Tax=Phytophthora infestans (strain T30-4) TaxID=403677 RepID=D0NL08_PHYIT|nr:uncharacterized protein PITG_12723 [Phytophthora infestans T30-4]EEY60326.1 conserved hypothetical protein [Phytophthora infestans T30-4]|eukprot:XP_002900122.1 conserved hypothetical protein [Phytophthora infestans T30-4]
MAPQRSYTILTKREAIATAEALGSCQAASKTLNIPRTTLRDWLDDKENIQDFAGAQTSKTLKGQSAAPIIHFSHDLVTFTKDVRREEWSSKRDGFKRILLESSFMDAKVWAIYVRELLKFEIEALSVLILDNFDAHVSKEGLDVVVETTSALVCQLPPNSTAACQPLDVEVFNFAFC